MNRNLSDCVSTLEVGSNPAFARRAMSCSIHKSSCTVEIISFAMVQRVRSNTH